MLKNLVKVLVLVTFLVTAVQGAVEARQNIGETVFVNQTGYTIVSYGYQHNGDNRYVENQVNVPTGSALTVTQYTDTGDYYPNATYRFRLSDGTYRTIYNVRTAGKFTYYIR